jgi:hypothetical protein
MVFFFAGIDLSIFENLHIWLQLSQDIQRITQTKLLCLFFSFFVKNQYKLAMQPKIAPKHNPR